MNAGSAVLGAADMDGRGIKMDLLPAKVHQLANPQRMPECHQDQHEGPPVEQVGAPGFGTRLLKSALTSFDGKTEVAYLKSGIHCTIQCRIPQS